MTHRPFSELEAKMSPESRERAKKKAEDMIRDITSCPSCALKDAEIERLREAINWARGCDRYPEEDGTLSYIPRMTSDNAAELKRRAYGEEK